MHPSLYLQDEELEAVLLALHIAEYPLFTKRHWRRGNRGWSVSSRWDSVNLNPREVTSVPADGLLCPASGDYRLSSLLFQSKPHPKLFAKSACPISKVILDLFIIL